MSAQGFVSAGGRWRDDKISFAIDKDRFGYKPMGVSRQSLVLLCVFLCVDFQGAMFCLKEFKDEDDITSC